MSSGDGNSEDDTRQRDEFANRLRKRDEKSTRSRVNLTGISNDLTTYNDTDREALFAKKREESSHSYLEKREAERTLLYEKQIYDEERLFDGISITGVERQRLESKKRILSAVDERKRLRVDENIYIMPQGTSNGISIKFLDYRNEATFAENNLFGILPTKEGERDRKGLDDGYVWEQSQISRASNLNEENTVKNELLFDINEISLRLSRVQQGDSTDEFKRALDAERRRKENIDATRKSLPVYAYREQILDAIKQYQVLIIVGETGSGKTTQIPQYLIEAGYSKEGKKIGCTQPRRVAAMSVASRVSDEMRVRLGYEVGYSIRFEDCTSEKTILKYMTDGMLIREFLTEPDLGSYSAIIIDEAHERTLHTDILFGLVKDIARYRSDLKIIISSATLDADKFSDYFDGAPIFTVPGRRFDVEIYYTKEPEPDYISAVIKTCMQVHLTPLSGDILVFLTGQEEIELVQDNLLYIAKTMGKQMREMIVAPIYSNLPSELQAKIFAPAPMNARKIVLATNIAETSITIDGVVFVIDPGFVKQKTFNPRTGMESLIVMPCSKASANQRAGRAGRVGPGKCFRLYTSWAFENELEANTVPEIQRTNLGNVVLLLKSLGINDLINFDFMDPPPPETLIRALEELYALAALNDSGELTKTGRRMAEFPVDPMMSKAILASEKWGCSEQVINIISMLSLQGSLFHVPKDRKLQAENARQSLCRPEGDHLTLLNIWEQWAQTSFSTQWCFENFIQHRSIKRARDVREQLLRLSERVEIKLTSSGDPSAIRKALLAGYFFQAACLQRSGEAYRTIKHGQNIFIHPASGICKERPKWVMYHELVLTSKEYMRQVTEIKPEWILEVAPHYFKRKEIEELEAASSGKRAPRPLSSQ